MNANRENLFFGLQRLALILFLVFPIALALLYQFKALPDNTGLYDLILLAPCILVFNGFLVYIFIRSERSRDWQAVALVIGFAVATRLAMLLILSTDLVSDVLDTHLFAIDIVQGHATENTHKYTYIPDSTYLNMTGLTYAGLYWIFGSSVKVVKLFMVALEALSCGLIYKVGKDLSRDHRVGLVASILFAAWPAIVCYTGIPTSEHMAMFLIMLTTSLWLSLAKNPKLEHWRPSLAVHLLLGALFGLVDWYRPVAVILVVACVISSFIYWERQKAFLQLASEMVVLIAAYLLVSDASVFITEKMHSVELPSNRQRLGQSVLIGTNPKYGGLHNWEDQGIIVNTYKEYYGEYDKARQVLLGLAYERVKNNIDAMPHLAELKFRRIWGSNRELLQASLEGANDAELIYYVSIFDDFLMITMTSLVFLSTLTTIVKRSSKEIFMMQLFTLGVALLIQITEAQMRYRTVVMPYFVILAAIGMKDGLTYLKASNRYSR